MCLLRSFPAPNPPPLGQRGHLALGVGFWSRGDSSAGEIDPSGGEPGLPRALGLTPPSLPPGSQVLPKGVARALGVCPPGVEDGRSWAP